MRRRRGVTELPRDLEYKRIFVLPTRFGFWFCILLFLMIVGGLNFNNNMTLLMVFLLGSVAMLTTLLAYRNLVGITVSGILAKPVFAGEQAVFRVLLKNPETRHRFSIRAISDDSRDCADIEPQNTRHLNVEQYADRRGWLEMAPFRIENRFPLGLFRARSVIIPEARCLVYPKPEPDPPPLPMSGGGELRIEAKSQKLESIPPGGLAFLASGRHVVISVSDTGVGMDEKTRQHIFEPFFSTKEKDKGTGLGLPIVKNIIEQHQGAIEIESKAGGGTRVSVELPCCKS